ncbi:hypothetical protein ACJX0J_013536, partial [Zea mays]
MENGQLSNEWAEEQNEQYLHDDWADSLGVFIENPEYANTFEDDTSSQQTFPSHEKAKGKEQKKLRKQKNVAHRGSAFTKEEDAVICSAFLHVSKDPIAGVNQSACAYYKRMYDFFCENKPERSTRSQIGIKKGGNLSKRQLVSFLHSNRKLIGEMKVAKNEQDRIDDVVKIKTQQPEGPCNPVGTQPNTENAAITRPEGRDTAKKRSAAVEHEMEVKNNTAICITFISRLTACIYYGAVIFGHQTTGSFQILQYIKLQNHHFSNYFQMIHARTMELRHSVAIWTIENGAFTLSKNKNFLKPLHRILPVRARKRGFEFPLCELLTSITLTILGVGP